MGLWKLASLLGGLAGGPRGGTLGGAPSTGSRRWIMGFWKLASLLGGLAGGGKGATFPGAPTPGPFPGGGLHEAHPLETIREKPPLDGAGERAV
jgi:hypothetical protein